MFRAGGAKLVWFSTLVKVASKRLMEALADVEALGETRVHVDHAGSLQYPDSAISESSRALGRHSEGVQIEEILIGLAGVCVSDAIRARNDAARVSHDHIGVRLMAAAGIVGVSQWPV